MKDWSDETLIARYRAEAGSLKSRPFLNELFERYHARLAAWCLRMTGNEDTAADLAQAVFLKAFQRIDLFRGDSQFSTWLYSIARNQWIDELRSKASRPQETTEPVLDQLPSVFENISTAMERREAEALMRRLIVESLDETEAEVMTLHYVHEMPLDSVTRMLRLSNPSGAKAFIVSARRKLSRAWTQRKSVPEGPKGGSYEK